MLGLIFIAVWYDAYGRIEYWKLKSGTIIEEPCYPRAAPINWPQPMEYNIVTDKKEDQR
jgi:hypothetical protein